MAGYVRKTVLSPSDVFARAREILPERVGLEVSRSSEYATTYAGTEGSVLLSAHRHSLYTDRLRTSRLDYEVQNFLNLLPYEVGDRGGPGSGDPSGDAW